MLVEWCKEWGVKINVAKSGVMHIRNKKAERCEMAYEVDGEAIPMVSSYKYLGCVVDEHLVLTEMVEERAEAGRRALGACFQRCQAEIGDIGIGIFRKLWGSLVESSMMYGVEIWGCSRHLEPKSSCGLYECSLELAHFIPRLHCYEKWRLCLLCGKQICVV